MTSPSDYPPLVREKELSDTGRALANGAAGRGGCLVIEGPPGVGETRRGVG